ncbi:MAG: B12-binding domain-containing radical SAM protein [Promethearchaeota archaeon]
MIPNRVDTPSSLLIMASILRKKNNNKINFIDCNGPNLSHNTLSDRLDSLDYDCVIFTFNSEIIEHEMKSCSLAKKKNPNCITIGYSWYARKYGKEVLSEFKDLDILILDDPFTVIENLINELNQVNKDLSKIEGIAYKNLGEIFVCPYLESQNKFDEFPLPAYDLIPSFKPYHIFSPLLRPYAIVYAGKGCPFQCEFCLQAKSKYHSKSVENIVKELQMLKKIGKVKYVWFFDEIFTINRKKVLKLCNEIIKKKIKIKWLCDSRVELVDLELLYLMKKAGCIGISYGVESGSQKILDSMKKGNTVEQAYNALKSTRKAGIPIQLNLILGYIGETSQTLKETEIFVKKTLPDILQVTRIYPLAETEFSKIAFKEGWVKQEVEGWKGKLKNHDITLLDSYIPTRLDLSKEVVRFSKMRSKSLKWILASVITALKNPVLLVPILGLIVSRVKQRIQKLISKN